MIQIPEPCSEDWNKMTSLEKGRYCAVCEKVILDFSTYTEKELTQHIKREGKVCGRVPSRYINTVLNDSTTNKGIGFRGIIATTINLLVLTVTATVEGQEKVATEQTMKQTMKRLESENSDTIFSKETKRVLKGQVFDEDKVPLPGASVIIEGTNCGVGTDYEGNFQLEIPDKFKTIYLLIQFIGMETQRIKIKDFDKPLSLYLKDDTKNLMGEVMVQTKKKKWLFF